MRPSTVRATWGLALPWLSLTYTLQGALLTTWTREFQFMATPHLLRLFEACVVGVLLGLISRSSVFDRRSGLLRAASMVAIAMSLGAIAHAASRPTRPRSGAFVVGLRNAATLRSLPLGAARVPSPFGIDETYVVRGDRLG